MTTGLPLWASEVALALVPELRDAIEESRDDLALVLAVRGLLAEAAARGYARAAEEQQLLRAAAEFEHETALQQTYLGRSLLTVREVLGQILEAASAGDARQIVNAFRRLLDEISRTRAAILSELDTEADDKPHWAPDAPPRVVARPLPPPLPAPPTPATPEPELAEEQAGSGVAEALLDEAPEPEPEPEPSTDESLHPSQAGEFRVFRRRQDDPPAPKRRGRPRKNPLPEQQEERET